MKPSLIIEDLGKQNYSQVWQAMQRYTEQRNVDTADAFWLVEHPPVFTQGLAGKAEHLLNPGSIPVIQTDRGGQVTYHGPGQLIVYVLIDLRRLNLGVRQLVCNLEQAIIRTLAEYGVTASGNRDAPGVYVNGAKICSIGLRIRKGCSYHGLAFNINIDTEPFSRINPCGFQGLKVIQLSDLIGPIALAEVTPNVVKYLIEIFGYTTIINENVHATTTARPHIQTTCSNQTSANSCQN